MYIDPADAAAMSPALAHKRDHIAVRHNRRPMYLLVVRQQLLAPALIADEEFAVDEAVATHYVACHDRIQAPEYSAIKPRRSTYSLASTMAGSPDSTENPMQTRIGGFERAPLEIGLRA